MVGVLSELAGAVSLSLRVRRARRRLCLTDKFAEARLGAVLVYTGAVSRLV